MGLLTPDRASQQSHKNFYVVRRGWNPGIYTSWGDAWVRIANFRDHTGESPEYAGASTYSAAIHYLGWDPRLSTAPRGPFPPAASVPFTRGPWPPPAPTPLPPLSPAPSAVVPSPPSRPASLAQRLEAATLAEHVPPATIAHVVHSLDPSGSPSGVVGLGGESPPLSSQSGRTETPESKLLREQKGFPEYPSTAFSGELFDQYYESVRNILHMPH